jgi:hypothetical protein
MIVGFRTNISHVALFRVANLKGTLIMADQLKKTRPPEDIPYFEGVSWEGVIDQP